MSRQNQFFGLADSLTSSAGVFRAKTSPRRAAGRDSTGLALDCSSRLFASCLKCEELGHQCPMCSLRTYLLSACEALSGLSLVWKLSTTRSGSMWWELGRSGHRTGVTVSGSSPASVTWPTPDCQNVRDGRQERSVSNLQPDGTGRHGVSLHHLVASLGLRPIQSLPQAGWPTPRAEDTEQTGPHGDALDTLTSAARANQPQRRRIQTVQITNEWGPNWPSPGAADGGGGSHLMPNDATSTGRRADGSKTAVTLPGIVRMEQWGTPRVTDNGGLGYQRENHRSRLEDQVVMEQPLPYQESVADQLWPTPRVSENDQGAETQQAFADGSAWQGANRGANLQTAVNGIVRRRIARPSALSAVDPPSTPVSPSPAPCATDVPSSWPTPRSSDNENRMTQPAPSHGQSHGRALAGEAHRWATPREADSRNIVTSEASMNDTAERSGPSLLQQARQPADLSGRAATHEPTSSEPSATPTIISDGENWATLTQRDFRSGRASQATMERNPQPLNEQVVADASSQLRPTPNCPAPHDSSISAGRPRPNRDIQMLCDAVGRQESCDGLPALDAPSTTGSSPGLLHGKWAAQLMNWPEAYTNALLEMFMEYHIKKSCRRRGTETR